MKKIYSLLIPVVLITLSITSSKLAWAGNEDRVGQAGAQELLINPWARSTGWGGVNTANAHGLEATFNNVAGLAFTEKTEIVFAQTIYLKGSETNISTFGFSQKINETSVIGLSVMALSVGDIQIRTVNQPDGGIGTFKPSFINIGISYAHTFSNSIYGGINFKIISESISDISAQGLAIDAGIQYVTGPKDNIKFGISLKNVGPTLSFSGDGFSFSGTQNNSTNSHTIEERQADFELPSLINIGGSYDFVLSEEHRLTIAGNFTSNSFSKDQYTIGAEYGFMQYLMLRAGFTYEKGIFDKATRSSALTGPCMGITVQAPINKEKGTTFSIDYSYRSSDPWQGCHTIGARFNL
ncbi:MAG: PorV/PorQ family protein [Bacteroidetes bacterium]|nr:PorV/PorQ family protein [Bacteroidota bacterium]